MSAVNPYEKANRDLESGRPTAHIWDEHGDKYVARFEKFETVELADKGPVQVLVGETQDGSFRSLWLFEADEPQEWHLKPKVEALGLERGDYVAIRRQPMKLTQSGNKIRYYDVSVTRAAELGGVEGPQPVGVVSEDTDPIPF